MIFLMENFCLTQYPLFSGFSDQQINQLLAIMEFCSQPANMVLFEQGVRTEYLYFLLEGEVTIHYKPYDGPSLIIAKIIPGNVFGWSAALNRNAYSSSALTKTDCKFLKIKSSNLTGLCNHFPETGALFLDRLVSVISERIKNTNQEIRLLLRNGIDVSGEC
jgi:CRP-like cAMP-binding protein